MRTPLVSVIVPVWNVRPYLLECLQSVLGQTIGRERLEIIAVDDGSTDGSGALLDSLAAQHPQLTAIHQPNSGGPGGPRNVGLDHAQGKYVFFLDADDYLGPEALERLVVMAERNGSDIVLPKLVSLGGRPLPRKATQRTLDRAPVQLVYSTLSVLKLFRREFLERIGLRFPEHVAGGEDGPFTARAYLEADVISVVADYPAYYCRARQDSQSNTPRAEDYDALYERFRGRIELLARYRGPGPVRDRMMARHIADVVRPFRTGWLERDKPVRDRAFDLAAALIRQWHTPRMARRSTAWVRIRAYCLGHGLRRELEDIAREPASSVYGDPIVRRGRLYARFPHFRDGSGIPDACFDITREVVPHFRLTDASVEDGLVSVAGEAFLQYVRGATTVVLSPVVPGRAYDVVTEAVRSPMARDRWIRHPKAGFRATFDPSTAALGRPLRAGLWRIQLRIGSEAISRTVGAHGPAELAGGRGLRSVTAMPWDGQPTLHVIGGVLHLRTGPVGRVDLLAARLRTRTGRIRRRLERAAWLIV